MDEVATVRTTRRRFWLCVVSVFFGGLVCGGLLGMHGFRYVYLYYPPPLNKMAERVAKKVQRDFNLDEATRRRIRDEIVSMAISAHTRLAEVNDDTKAIVRRHGDRIADLMPTDASRERWLREADQYLPVPPPIPPAPAPAPFLEHQPGF